MFVGVNCFVLKSSVRVATITDVGTAEELDGAVIVWTNTARVVGNRLAAFCCADRSISLDVRPMLRTAMIVCRIWPSYSGPIMPPLMLWPRPCKDARELGKVAFLVFFNLKENHGVWFGVLDNFPGRI